MRKGVRRSAFSAGGSGDAEEDDEGAIEAQEVFVGESADARAEFGFGDGEAGVTGQRAGVTSVCEKSRPLKSRGSPEALARA